MKSDEWWFQELSPIFGKEAQLKSIRRIQADTIAWVLLDQMNDFPALRRKLELRLKELEQ